MPRKKKKRRHKRYKETNNPVKEQEQHQKPNEDVPDNTPQTTVFLAAPDFKNHRFAITGNDANLGYWENPMGCFEKVFQVSKDLSIFKGTVPVPTKGSRFKFIHFNTITESKIEYEGNGSLDDRTEELIPDSLNFFVFKPITKSSWTNKLRKAFTIFPNKPETNKEIAKEFINILFNHIMENLLSDWDGAFEFLNESLGKIRQAVGDFETSAGFRLFLNEWLEKPELLVKFDKLMLVLVGAWKTGAYTDKIKDVLQPNSKEFSIYLHEFRYMKQKRQDLFVVMERIALNGGPEFFWIFFRINRQTEMQRELAHQEVSKSILKTLQNIPEVLLDDPECAARVVEYLVRWFDIDELYFSMRPVFAKNAKYQRFLDPLLLTTLLTKKSSIDDLTKILRSDLVKKVFESTTTTTSMLKLDNKSSSEQNRTNLFQESLNTIFNQKLSDVVKLACCTPEYLLPVVTRFVDSIVLTRMKSISDFAKDDYHFFCHQLENPNLNNFHQTKQLIETMLLKITAKYLESATFQSVPSMKLTLLGLAERKEIPYLERAKLIDLKNALSRSPRKFFQNLHSYMNAFGTSVETTLEPHRNGRTRDVVDKISTHFEHTDTILTQVQNQRISLIELPFLNDLHVLDYLKTMGLTKLQEAKLYQNLEELKRRHNLFSLLYDRFAQLTIICSNRPTAAHNIEDVEETSEEDENVENRNDDENANDDSGENDDDESPSSELSDHLGLFHVASDDDEENDDNDENNYDNGNDDNNSNDDQGENSNSDEENVGGEEFIQVLDSEDWKKYLKDTDSEQSFQTLRNALNLDVPLELNCAEWLKKVSESELFMNQVWHPMLVELVPESPLCKKGLLDFVHDSSARWADLARSVAEGTVTFQQMNEIIRLQSDANVLTQTHLESRPINGVELACRNFTNLQELRHHIGAFVSALPLFSIRKRDPINALHDFVENNLLKHWDDITLHQVTEAGVLQAVNDELCIDPNRPETLDAMQFIGSLVTDGNRSPVIEWLRERNEKDLEAMGKILQGTLLVAYGQLQTLRTRIAPFLLRNFETYQELLRVVRESEERFAQRISGRVQPIDCKWLANMLPEIEAAIRASVISPSEDAKEKLAKLNRVCIDPRGDAYAIEVRLKPEGSLTMEELKQAFQLLDMAVVDDSTIDVGARDMMERTRHNVGLIEKISVVFGHLFASGCITYTFQEPKVIELDQLEPEIERMRDQLAKWNNQWKGVEEMPLLSLLSRGYLLELADMIGRNKVQEALSVLKIFLPLAPSGMDKLVNEHAKNAPCISDKHDYSWLLTDQLFEILRKLNAVIETVFYEKGRQVDIPQFLEAYERVLNSYFIDKAVVILNVSRELLVGSSLAAYFSITRRPIEPSRILFVTANTDKEEVDRFMILWSVADNRDLFIIVHVERLSVAGVGAVREGVDRVLPERRAKLLLLAQHRHRVQTTKALGSRLGLVSDRRLQVSFTCEQLRNCISTLLPSAANLHFFTSNLPGCGKSQQAMRLAFDLASQLDYYRISIRIGSVEELLAGLKKIELSISQSENSGVFLHLDVAHSVSLEFNDILLSLLIHGAVYDPKKAKLGFWMISKETTIAVEFASPLGAEEFPVISYLGKHHICECSEKFFRYDLVSMPKCQGQPVSINRSNALIAAGKFLQLKGDEQEGLQLWDGLCSQPESLVDNPLAEELTFDLLMAAFQHEEHRFAPTFTALSAMASFLHRHICAMITSIWFNSSAIYLFKKEHLALIFKQNCFDMLLKVGNDCLTRCWSVVNKGRKLPDMDWIERQRAMFLLGIGEDGSVTGMNVVGRDEDALKGMFLAKLLPVLQQQCIHFQELRGFKNLMLSQKGSEVIVNAMRSLLLLDGTTTSADKVLKLDNYTHDIPANQRLRDLIGKEHGYVLTGDNITKMMFALYRIRCGLPVVVFGEAGVGKTALFRFLIQTLLGHTFQVCNVNSGTSIRDVELMINSAVEKITNNPKSQVFLFFDEMNTADPPVIAFLKELMLDRHCHGTVLPENLHLIAAANPYRHLPEADREAAVGLAFRFAQDVDGSAQTDGRNLVYRVNELPVAFYDHIYDFGRLCEEAEDTYIDEICQHGLPSFAFHTHTVKNLFVSILQKSHRVARALSVDPESAVSLRDATRAVQLFRWFCTTTAGRRMTNDNRKKAIDLTIYLVYAFRFRKRKIFLENVFGRNQSASDNMKQVSRLIAKMLYEKAHGASIGSGAIALNDALCENLFALFVCVLNGIFLIIVGRPGSSKSLSVEILKLVLSPGNHTLRQSLGDLPAITELYFQCSPLCTSLGFKALFESAQKLSVDQKTMLAMVVLDELGLADLSPEKPIKVLHAELERKSVLTSGEEQQSPYSVVALSNWVVDAAQVNRGILISRTPADNNDLIASAEQLADSLIAKYVRQSDRKWINSLLFESLGKIVRTYQEIDKRDYVEGGHFFSMRDFFFCVKNFVCSVLESIQVGGTREWLDVLRITECSLVRSTIRNFGGHERARKFVSKSMAVNTNMTEKTIQMTKPLDLIVQNIRDSSKPLSIHIARHLMILSRSLIGLPLLSRHVKSLFKGDRMSWNILFGSCFPGDLQVTAVTRKLRQVEQAIRMGGVLILCHADQLFESLYMVLNQQYWSQGDVTMTQIALGPSIRAIALPNGPFRIIALQDTDVALNPKLMSPAILSRFEKHELRPSDLLDEAGGSWLNSIESHPVCLAVPEAVKRQKLLYGYHEESFVSLALHLQERTLIEMLDRADVNNMDPHIAFAILMRAANPMAMIKLERDSVGVNSEVMEACRFYRHNFVLENLNDALEKIKADRMIVMTNTFRHLEVMSADESSTAYRRHFTIQLFDVQTEMELDRLLGSIKPGDLADPEFCLVIQYDAVTGPIEQFQLTKYEVEKRFESTKCRVILIVHVDPRPVNMHWIFSFGDGWDYCFVDEVVPGGQADPRPICLEKLVRSPADQPMSALICQMPIDSFKSLLLEMLGPVLQESLVSLRSNLGQFYHGVRTALGLPGNQLLVQLLNECLVAQLDHSQMMWNVLDAANDANFDSSSSLTEGLWGVFKHKISNQLAHLLIVSDVWRVSDESLSKLWCDFVTDNYDDRLMSFNSSNSLVQMPVGFSSCTRPFGRLLSLLDTYFVQGTDSRLNTPLHWLLNRIATNKDENSQEVKQAYFLDWFLLCIPPHLHRCMKRVPLSRMGHLVDSLFDAPREFFIEWEHSVADVIAALELVSIASFASADDFDLWNSCTVKIRNWKLFVETAARLSLEALAAPDVLQTHHRFIPSVSSIEASLALTSLLDGVKELPQLWLGLRITKRILLFDPKSSIKPPELQVSTPQILFDSLQELVIDSVIRPRVLARGRQGIQQAADLNSLLTRTSACNSLEELSQLLGECPKTNSILLLVDNNFRTDGRCSSCGEPLTTPRVLKAARQKDTEIENEEILSAKHLRAPDTKKMESLFQDHQKFMFFFEHVTELFIQQRKDNPNDIREFMQYLLGPDCRLRLSWRFLTVIVRTVLSTRDGSTIFDELLSTIRFKNLGRDLTPNSQSLLRALLACADHDARLNFEGEPFVDVIQAAMTSDVWTVERIRLLALIRHQLTSNDVDATANIIVEEWGRWRKNQKDTNVTDSLLYFILRFSSNEGDQTRLSNLFRHQQVTEELGHHQIVGDYIHTLSPLSLGFDLHPTNGRAVIFQRNLFNGRAMGLGVYEHYPLLSKLQPDWAPFIARLAYHATDVFEVTKIRLLQEMSTNLVATVQSILPGIDNHPYLTSFMKNAKRWYVCSCGTLNCVGDCGRPTPESICASCRVPLSVIYHEERDGVRQATWVDFEPPTGIYVTRAPFVSSNYAVRNCSPVVTRFALLLNSLALMNAALNPRTMPQAINQLLLTLPISERRQNEDRGSLIQLLSDHIVVHLDILCQLLETSRPQLNQTDQFRIGHILLHKLLAFEDTSLLLTAATDFKNGLEARESFEEGLATFLSQQHDLGNELENIVGQENQASKTFQKSMLNNGTSYWAYTRFTFADRQSVQLELARNEQLRSNFPFLNMVLDDDNWKRKLNALQYLGDAMRFIALVRTVLQGEVTIEEANRWSISQGLEKIIDAVNQKPVILDRGRQVVSRDHVMSLFDSFKQLWDRFSQLENIEEKTFLNYFECQQVDINIRPNTVLESATTLILILAGSDLPETTFSCQLLSHAVEAASSVALNSFIQPYCRAGSGRVRLSCSSAAALTDFDESLYAHVSNEEVDRFIRDHAIDKTTLQLAESFAMSAVLGPVGSTIANDLSLDAIPGFVFKDDMESANYLVSLERRSLAWQPSSISPPLQELILSELEKNRSLAEARSALVSTITHLQSSTDPLVVSKIRNHLISDVLEEMMQAEILTERHVSNATLNILNRHLKLEVCHAFGLLKAIISRMKGDDIFGGRIPEGWKTMLTERLAQLTSQKLRSAAQQGSDIKDTLLQLANTVATSKPVPECLKPDKSLLFAIRLSESPDWDGIPAELKMENLGHVLLIVESLY